MWPASFDLPDTSSDRLRALLATIAGELERLDRPPPADGSGDPLKRAFAELTELLDVAPAPATQTCPSCRRVSRALATRCVYCWAALAGAPPP